MAGNKVTKFSYIPRSGCICGLSLSANSREVIRRFPSGDVRFLRCDTCQSWIQTPVLTLESLSAWYDSVEYRGDAGMLGIGYVNYARDETHRAAEAALRYRALIAPLLSYRSQVLEVGCGTGTLLAEIAKHGHVVYGCDLSNRFVETARRIHGIEVHLTDWLNLKIPAGSLDAVLLFGTISNLQQLNESLRRAHDNLKLGGTLLFNFPDSNSFPALLYGRRHWMFTPSVMQFMTTKGISGALRKAGFKIVETKLDRQAPSLGKLLGHARLSSLYPLLDKLKLLDVSMPFLLPIPGVSVVRAISI